MRVSFFRQGVDYCGGRRCINLPFSNFPACSANVIVVRSLTILLLKNRPTAVHRAGVAFSSVSNTMSAAKETVCVTGATGFIATWLVKKLLEGGYTVRATVRDPSQQEKVKHLTSLPHATERLHLVKADLLTEGSFQEAVQGCSGVFHTASPFITTNVTDPQTQLLDPALKGTLNVLKSVAASPGFRRVVLTSSVAAVAYDPDRNKDKALDESNWSKESFLTEKKMWYQLSKLLAERAAWQFAEEHNIDLVVINPAMVIGPLLQPTLNTSSEAILKYVTGENKVFPNFALGWVHVEDVADAHIMAFEKAEAKGRFLLVASWIHWKDICVWLRTIEPSAPITEEYVAGVWRVGRDWRDS